MSGLDLEKHCWDIIDTYFKTIPNYIAKNQITSYNIFLDDQISKTIRQFNPLQFMYELSPEKKYEIDVMIGGTLEDGIPVNNGKGIQISKPTIHEKVKKVNEDGTISETITNKLLYPNEARLKNLTYTIGIYCDIHFQYTIVNGTDRQKLPLVSFSRVFLGRIPCMLQSKGCVLSDIKQSNLKDFGECIFDQGGYFIIDGKEKVITAQTRQIENKIYTKRGHEDDNWDWEAEIRSTPEDKLQPARITKIQCIKKKDNDTNLLKVMVPNLTAPVDIFILFRALGVTSDKDILNHICGDIKHGLGKTLSELLYDNITVSKGTYTQMDALLKLSNLIRYPGAVPQKKKTDEEEFDEEMPKLDYEKLEDEFTYIYDILYNWFLPHMGTNNLLDKAKFLGYMARELLKTKLGLIEATNRDSYIYKRIDISGFLVATIFRDLYFRVKNKFSNGLNSYFNRQYSQSRITDENLNELINPENISVFFDREIMTDGFKYAFKNCWGLRDAPCKQGVVQDLGRLTYLGMISHLRRVITPLPAGSKMRGPHMLNLSTYGILCPVETPDGGNVGVKTNIALFTDITFGTHSGGVYQALLDNRLITLEQQPYSELVKNRDLVAVLLNGRLVGMTAYPNLMVKRLRLLRRNALINVYTSIAWYIERGEIKISTDSGRSCHPLLIVDEETSKLKITKQQIRDVQTGKINWRHLIAGREDWSDYDHRYYAVERSNEELEKTAGVLEFIDTEEANTLLFAFNSKEIGNGGRFTHCEIHPTIMFGIMGSIIPYAQTNQLPRNLYSCGQGKQAIGIYATNYNNRMDTKTQVLYYPQKPLSQTRVSQYLYNNDMPYGTNAIVAVACYSGYNQDDSIIFNRSAVQRGIFRSIKFRTYSIREELNEYTKQRSQICNPVSLSTTLKGVVVKDLKPGNYSKLDEYGIVKEGVHVDENDIVVGKVIITNDTDEDGNQIYIDASEYVRRAEQGTVDKVFYSHDNNDFLFVKVRIRKEKIPELGDKFASRAGQKGIMGMILDETDMPVSKNGIRPDIIINPQAFPKRMTISQFIESFVSKECSLTGIFADSSPFNTLPLDKMGEVLQNQGYERFGCEILYNGMSGEQLTSEIFIGPTYYERLQHQVVDKMHSRAQGSVTMITKQPTGGRSIGGGLRIGEMERDAILGHGLTYFLKESMCDRADSTELRICDGCGNTGMINLNKNIFHCYACNSTRVFYKNGKMNKEQIENSKSTHSTLIMPYAMKLLRQELEAMSIDTRLITDNVSTQWKKMLMSDTYEEETQNSIQKMIDLEKVSDKYYAREGSQLDRPFRKFQNAVKRILIEGASFYTKTFLAKDNSIIDFAAGRGGDLDKWIKADFKSIVALDIDQENVFNTSDCLQKRIKERLDSGEIWFNNGNIEIGVNNACKDFYNGDGFKDTSAKNKKKLSTLISERGTETFDVVSVQFAAHYCFGNKIAINNLFKNVKNSLKQGGIFLVTMLDGERTWDLLVNNQGNVNFYVGEERVYGIRGISSEQSEQEIKPIQVFLHSTGRYIDEFLVDKDFMIREAKKNGLELLENHFMENYFRAQRNNGNPTDNFTNFDVSNELDKNYFRELKEFSSLYRYYVFVKKPEMELSFSTKDQCISSIQADYVLPMSFQNIYQKRSLYQSKGISFSTKLTHLDQQTVELLRKKYDIDDYKRSQVFNANFNRFEYDIPEINAFYVRIVEGELVVFKPIKKYDTGRFDKYTYDATNTNPKTLLISNITEEYVCPPEFVLMDGKLAYFDGRTYDKDSYPFIYDYFNTVCQKQGVSDTEFIFYSGSQAIINEENIPIFCFQENKRSPSIALPNPFEWAFATGKTYKTECFNIKLVGTETTNWSNKSDSVGFYDTPIDPEYSKQLIADEYSELLHFKFIEWPKSYVIHKEEAFYNPLYQNAEPIDLVQTSKHKYILTIDNMLSMIHMYLGSVVIVLDNPSLRPWFFDIVPSLDFGNSFINGSECFIRISNYKEIPDVIEWLKTHDNEAEKMTRNAQKMAKKMMTTDFMTEYGAYCINEIYSYDVSIGNENPENYGDNDINYSRNVEEDPITYTLNDLGLEIINKNKELISKFYNIDIKTDENRLVVYYISNPSNFQAFFKSITENERITIPIDNIVSRLIYNNKSIIENYFNIFLIVKESYVVIIGNKTDINSANKFITQVSNTSKIPTLPTVYRGYPPINFEEIKQLNVSKRIGLIFVGREGEDYVDKEKIIKHIQNMGVSFEVVSVKQSKYTQLKNLPQSIVQNTDSNGVILKYNPIALASAGALLLSKDIESYLVFDSNYDVNTDNLNQYITEATNSNKPILGGPIITFNQRNTIYNLPTYYYGTELDILRKVLKRDIPILTQGMLFTQNKQIVHQIDDLQLEVSELPQSQFINIISHINNEYIVDFSEGSFPLVLPTSDLTPIVNDNKNDVRDYVVKYLQKVLKPENVYEKEESIHISELISSSYILRILEVIKQVIKGRYKYQVNYDMITNYQIKLRVGEKQKVAELSELLPFYTYNNKIITEPITTTELEQTREEIEQLKKTHKQTLGFIIQRISNRVFVERIGDIVYYYNLVNDDINILDLQKNTFIEPSDDIQFLERMSANFKWNNQRILDQIQKQKKFDSVEEEEEYDDDDNGGFL